MIVRFCAVFAILLFLQPKPSFAAEIRLYSANPAHPANLLHDALFVRLGFDKREYGLDRVDPLYWPASQFLLQGPSLEHGILALMDFLNLTDVQLRELSLRQRAVLQRDLWAVFDSVSSRLTSPNQAQTRFLMGLAAGIRRLAFSQFELNQLQSDSGENYIRILKRNGWVEVASEKGHPIAAAHVDHLSGRSTAVVLMKSGSAQDTVGYLRSLFEFPNPLLPARRPGDVPELNPLIPKFGSKTQFVFARFANLIRNDGQIVATPIFELFQTMMVLNDGSWQFSRAEFSRTRYFSNARNGLVGVSKTDSDFLQLLTSALDPFEDRRRWFKQNVLVGCTGCHLPNIQGVESYVRDFQTQLKTPRIDRMVPQVNSVQFELTRAYKETDPNWKRLKAALVAR